MDPLDAFKALADAFREEQGKVIKAAGGEPFAGYGEHMQRFAAALEHLQSEVAAPPPEAEPEPAPAATQPKPEPAKAHPEEPSIPEPVLAALVELPAITPEDIVYHLGCGDGRLLIKAASLHQARGTGIDPEQEHVGKAREKIRKARLQNRLSVTAEDPLLTDVSAATVVFLTLGPRNAEMLAVVRRQLQPGARIVTHQRVETAWPPHKERAVALADGKTGHVYLWLVQPHRAADSIGGLGESAWEGTS